MKKVLLIFFSVFVIFMNVLTANASENMLSNINVKRGENSYTIELTTTEPAKMSKTIISSDRILVNLGNVKALNNVPTKYESNAVIDNVIVESQGKDVSIMLQGDNIAYSDITFKSPSSIQQLEDSVIDTISSVGLNVADFSKNKTLPSALLLVLAGILVFEIRFIKSKYNELNEEKSLLEKDLERTSDFKEYTMGYGNQGLTKPYTTPIYSNPKNTSLVRANYLQRLKTLQTPETVTLNSILSDKENESEIIDKIVNPKPVFGSLSNIRTSVQEKDTRTTTNPVSKAKLKNHVEHLETLSKLYQQSNTSKESIQHRLNGLY